MKAWIWSLWLLVVVAIAGYFSWQMFASDNKEDFLIGESTYGHFQIEMACETCHTSAFGGPDVLQNACTNCHAEDLEQGHDSHPRKKFTDPRNANTLEILDARYCMSCHTEHQREQTHPMGVTLPEDYCFHCHEDIGEERESHKDLPFDSCGSAGCHNFHDNRALYESFLVDNANQPWLLEIATLQPANAAHKKIKPQNHPLTITQADYTGIGSDNIDDTVLHEWETSSHAQAGVNCMDCHADNDHTWIEKPTLNQCKSCHSNEVETFTQGRHGMRLSTVVSQPLANISPAESDLPFTEMGQQLHQSCSSCHSSHEFNRVEAAVTSCLNCHADDHSLAYLESPHGKNWSENIAENTLFEEGVSCATCHMPRMIQGKGEKATVSINHNQNFNLRPNEKMIRSVCMNCHGLGFAINALADEELIQNNFNGQPGVEIESINWALKREE